MHKKIIMMMGLMILFGCSVNDVKDTIGLNRQSPDEFMILTNEPLQMPKNNRLVAPGTVQKIASNRASPQQQAKEALGMSSDNTSSGSEQKLSQGEQGFLSNVKTGDKNIVSKIEEDRKKQRKSIITDAISVDVVDSQSEADRIEELQKNKEKITGENTNTVKARVKEGR